MDKELKKGSEQDRLDIMDLIPSKDMRDYLREISYHFSDEERLAIIEDRTYLWEERKRWLTDFIGTSRNDSLTDYASQYLEATERYLSEFKMTSSNDLIYRSVCYYEDGSEKSVLYSYEYEEAYRHVVTPRHGPEQLPQDSFSIEKIRVYSIGDGTDEQEKFETLNFDESGSLKVPTPFNYDAYGYPDSFEGGIHAPHPFKNGDIVEVLRRYDPEKRYFAVVNEGYPDQYPRNVVFNDFVVFVESYFAEDMEFGHDHISPFDIEFCREPEMLKYPSILEAAQALLTQRRRITLEEFTMQLHRPGKEL